MKKILTIIPFYNVEKHLERAIESILQQTYQNVELVLVDDCSTDNSLKIAQKYQNVYNVTLLKNNQNKGTYYSVNKALDFYKDKEWDYWQFHGSDDMSDITRFEKLIKIYNSNSNLVALKCTCAKCDYNTFEIKNHPNTGQPDIYTGEGIAFYDRKILKYLGYYDDTRFSGDTDLWWRLEALINNNSEVKHWELGESKEILYITFDQENNKNLTKIYDFHTTRPKYWGKIKQQINNEMIPNNNFKRNFKI